MKTSIDRIPGAAGRWALRTLPVALALSLGAAPASPVVAPPTDASPIIRISEEFYDIRGSTAEELGLEMRRLGPEEDGRRFHGHTAWNINWRYTSQPWGNACGATRVEVTAVIVITLPRWDPPPQAPDELRHRWDVYLTALREHEEGHRDLAVAAARRVHSRLSGFRTGDCRTFSREANAEGRYILDRLRADNRRYDEETGHGRTQGAVWRPG
jgi:predicted secreted Zn-dependent protease